VFSLGQRKDGIKGITVRMAPGDATPIYRHLKKSDHNELGTKNLGKLGVVGDLCIY